MFIDKKFYNDNNAFRSLYDWKNLQLSLPRVESGSENRIFSRIPALLIITLVGKSILRAFFAKRAQNDLPADGMISSARSIREKIRFQKR